MFRELREAWRIVQIEKETDGYRGPYVVLRESMMEEMQLVYGRAVEENTRYIAVLEKALKGQRICDDCEDCKDCDNYDKWTEGGCPDFLLRFPSDDEAREAFNGLYKECEGYSDDND